MGQEGWTSREEIVYVRAHVCTGIHECATLREHVQVSSVGLLMALQFFSPGQMIGLHFARVAT